MSAVIPLGDFVRVALTDAWPTEDRNFTPWLAGEQSIKKLGEALQLDLEVESVEHWVGPFRADIIARATDETDHRVLIENQFGRTDHGHLGQIMTYLAGVESAKTVVWIAETFQENHRAAIDWLNTHTEDDYSFFAVEIELWRIGDSAPAPRFNVVASPNDWTRQARTAARTSAEGGDRESHLVRLAYWASFGEYLKAQGSNFRINRANRDHWFTFPIGRAGFHILATVSTMSERIGVELYAANDLAKVAFGALAAQREAIEKDFGEKLDWQELPGKKAWRVGLYRPDSDPSDRERFPEYHAWMLEKMKRFDAVFRQRVRILPLAGSPQADVIGDEPA